MKWRADQVNLEKKLFIITPASAMWQLHMCSSSSSMKSVPSSIHTRKLYLLLHYKLTPTMRRLSFPSRYLCLFACHVHLPFVHIIMLQVVSFKKYSCSSLLPSSSSSSSLDDYVQRQKKKATATTWTRTCCGCSCRFTYLHILWKASCDWAVCRPHGGPERDTACQLILGVGY